MPPGPGLSQDERGQAAARLFDANVWLGVLPPSVRPPDAPEDVPALLAVMDGYGLARALVTHSAAKWHHPPTGNARLAEATAGQDRLLACRVVLPAATGEVPA